MIYHKGLKDQNPNLNASVLSNMANQMQGPTDTEKPIMRYMESSDAE